MALGTSAAPAAGPTSRTAKASAAPTQLASPARPGQAQLARPPDLFEEGVPLQLEITGPLQTAFSAAHAGEPDALIPGLWTRAKEPFAATVSTGGAAGPKLDATLKVRGNLSLSECAFPKVSVKFDDHSPEFASSILGGTEQLKVGTHCADPSGTSDQISTQGRLIGEKSTHREAIAWNLYRVIDPEYSLHARTAHVKWVDTSSTAPQVTERDAFVFEHPKSAARRLGLPNYVRTVNGKKTKAPVLEDSELNAVSPKDFSPQRARQILMFQALIGNWDFAVDVGTAKAHDGHVWNTDVLVAQKPNGARELVPVPTDFDRATIVSGKLPSATPRQTPEDRQVADFLKKYLARYPKADVVLTKKLFKAKQQALQQVIDNTPVDEEGRRLAQRHLDAFFRAVDRLFPG